MEQYIVSARKYRPSTFHSVVGQSSLTTTLKNAIAKKQLAHAYLFCGPRGVGKTTCARIFAKTINCTSLSESGEACNQCESCVSFHQQRSLNIFEMDAASNNSVDDIRELVKQVMIPPQIGKYRVYIIDEVHMLSTAAFNAFLKTLEEPPSYAIFILATTEKHKILPTIISRCQVYDFNRIQVTDTVEYLKYVANNEQIEAEEEALRIIAEKADGAMRDALSIFDQIVSFCGKEIKYKDVADVLNVLDYEYYFQAVNIFLSGSIIDALLMLDKIINKGFDVQSFISGISSHLRDLLVAKDERSVYLLQTSDSVKNKYIEQAKQCEPSFLFKALNIATACELGYKTTKNKRLSVELMLIKICQIVAPLTDNCEKKNTNTTVIQKIKISPEKQSETRPKPITTESPKQQKSIVEPIVKKNDKPKIVVSNNQLNISKVIALQTADKTTKASTSSLHTSLMPQEDTSNNDFSQEDLIKAWKDYAQEVADRTFFAKYVLDITPKKDGSNCVINVISKQQLKEFSDSRFHIEKYLCSQLNNDKVKLLINKDKIEIEKQLSPEDVLNMMCEKNNNIKKLMTSLNLELKL